MWYLNLGENYGNNRQRPHLQGSRGMLVFAGGNKYQVCRNVKLQDISGHCNFSHNGIATDSSR